jgi:hypothetical protein
MKQVTRTGAPEWVQQRPSPHVNRACERSSHACIRRIALAPNHDHPTVIRRVCAVLRARFSRPRKFLPYHDEERETGDNVGEANKDSHRQRHALEREYDDNSANDQQRCEDDDCAFLADAH